MNVLLHLKKNYPFIPVDSVAGPHHHNPSHMTDVSTNNRHDTLSDVRVFLQREAPDRAKTIEVVCSSARRDMDRHATHQPYRLFTETLALFPECTDGEAGRTTATAPSWPQSTTICCWHDCHPFDTTPIPIPKSKHNNTYKVYGVVCSGNCGVAYILNKNTYDQQLQLMLFKGMLIDVFGLAPDDVYALEAAPPSIFLNMFGGHLDIAAFRHQSLHARSALLTPPFISYTMVLEENARLKEAERGEARVDGAIAPISTHVIRGLRRPTAKMVVEEDELAPPAPHATSGDQKPSLFELFVRNRVSEHQQEASGAGGGSTGDAMVVEDKPARAVKRAPAAKGSVKRTAASQGVLSATAGTLAAYLAPS